MNRLAIYRGVGVVARAIQLQTRSYYSHAAILLHNGSVIEATGNPFLRGRVRRVSGLWSQHGPGNEVDLFAVDAPVDMAAAERWLHGCVGAPYDYRSVARFLTRRPAEVNHKYFCSELVFGFYQAGGVDLLQGIEAHNVSPRDLSLSPYLRHLETRTAP